MWKFHTKNIQKNLRLLKKRESFRKTKYFINLSNLFADLTLFFENVKLKNNKNEMPTSFIQIFLHFTDKKAEIQIVFINRYRKITSPTVSGVEMNLKGSSLIIWHYKSFHINTSREFSLFSESNWIEMIKMWTNRTRSFFFGWAYDDFFSVFRKLL